MRAAWRDHQHFVVFRGERCANPLAKSWGVAPQVYGDVEGISPEAQDDFVVSHGRKLKVQTAQGPWERIGGVLLGERGLQTEFLPERPMEDFSEKASGVPGDCGAQLETAWDDGLDDCDPRTNEGVLVDAGLIAE